jgi:hypothetical protein
MKTKILIGVLVSFLVISVAAVTTSIAANDKAKEEPKGPGDKAKAPDLEKIEFIHWRKGFAKPGTDCGNGDCEPGENWKKCPEDCPKRGEEEPPEPTPTCYAVSKYGKRYLKWRELPVDYVINPTDSGLNDDDVTTAISAGADEWDFYVEDEDTELFGTYAVNYSVAYGNLDDNNAICFGDYYLDPGIIGAATVWYNPATKTIVEFDIVFETDYTWGYAGTTSETELGDTSVMDLQNIAIHELGHGVGLDDVYEDTCSEVTMYGISVEGETKKRTLEEPDIIGILILYP